MTCASATPTTPPSVFNVPRYNVCRRDGVMQGLIYVEGTMQSQQMNTPASNLECVRVKITLSPQTSSAVAVYRPAAATKSVLDCIADVLHQYAGSEMILMGDLNLNWLDKARRKRSSRTLSKCFR